MSAHVYPFHGPFSRAILPNGAVNGNHGARIDRPQTLCYPTAAHRFLLPPGNQKATDDTTHAGHYDTTDLFPSCPDPSGMDNGLLNAVHVVS